MNIHHISLSTILLVGFARMLVVRYPDYWLLIRHEGLENEDWERGLGKRIERV